MKLCISLLWINALLLRCSDMQLHFRVIIFYYKHYTPGPLVLVDIMPKLTQIGNDGVICSCRKRNWSYRSF